MSKFLCLMLCLFILTISIQAFAAVMIPEAENEDVAPLCDICILDVFVDSPFGEAEIRFDCNDVYVDLGDVWWDEQEDPVWKVFKTNGYAGTITLHERFHITGTTPFSDWDEQLFKKDSCGQWVPSDNFDNLYWTGGESDPEGVFIIDEEYDIITVEWDPALEPCTIVEIVKTIHVPRKDSGNYWFAVREMPSVPDENIPEPSIYAISGMVLLGFLVRRRK